MRVVVVGVRQESRSKRELSGRKRGKSLPGHAAVHINGAVGETAAGIEKPRTGRPADAAAKRPSPHERAPYFACRALTALKAASARSNFSSNSHIAVKISAKVADVFARSALPNVKMLLLRR